VNLVKALERLDDGIRRMLVVGLYQASTETSSGAVAAGDAVMAVSGTVDAGAAIRQYLSVASRHKWVALVSAELSADDEAVSTALVRGAARSVGVDDRPSPGQVGLGILHAWWTRTYAEAPIPELNGNMDSGQLSALARDGVDRLVGERTARIAKDRKWAIISVALALLLAIPGAFMLEYVLSTFQSLVLTGSDLLVKEFGELVPVVLSFVPTVVLAIVAFRKWRSIRRVGAFDDRFAALVVSIACVGAPDLFVRPDAQLPGHRWDAFLDGKGWSAQQLASARTWRNTASAAEHEARQTRDYWFDLRDNGPALIDASAQRVSRLTSEVPRLEAAATRAAEDCRECEQRNIAAQTTLRAAEAQTPEEESHRSQQADLQREIDTADRSVRDLKYAVSEAEGWSDEEHPEKMGVLRERQSRLATVQARYEGRREDLAAVEAAIKRLEGAREVATAGAKDRAKAAESEYARAKGAAGDAAAKSKEAAGQLRQEQSTLAKLREDVPRATGQAPAAQTAFENAESNYRSAVTHLDEIETGRKAALSESWTTAFARVKVNPAVVDALALTLDEPGRIALERALAELDASKNPASIGRAAQTQDRYRVGTTMPDGSVWDLEYAVQQAASGLVAGVHSVTLATA
jgi:hypothetical protein